MQPALLPFGGLSTTAAVARQGYWSSKQACGAGAIRVFAQTGSRGRQRCRQVALGQLQIGTRRPVALRKVALSTDLQGGFKTNNRLTEIHFSVLPRHVKPSETQIVLGFCPFLRLLLLRPDSRRSFIVRDRLPKAAGSITLGKLSPR